MPTSTTGEKEGRNEVYGIRDQKPKKGWDPGSQPRDLGSQPPGSGSAVFFMDSGIKLLRVQGSKFSSFLGSGIKILAKNMGSVTKNIPRYDPERRVVGIIVNVWLKACFMISVLSMYMARFIGNF